MKTQSIIGEPIKILWESETVNNRNVYKLTQLLVTDQKDKHGSNLFFLNIIEITSTRGIWEEGDSITRALQKVSSEFALSKNRDAIVYLSDHTLENLAFRKSWRGSEHLMTKPENINRLQRRVHRTLTKRFKNESKSLISKKKQRLQRWANFKVANHANNF